jgi:glycosyltransferase involved in cell wall biosynthesis
MSKYNIYINGRFLTQPISGVQRYAIEVVKALDSLIDEGLIDYKKFTIYLLTPKGTTNNIIFKNIIHCSIGRFQGHLWEQCDLPLYARDGILLNLCSTGPLLKIKQLVTIHDAAVCARPQGFSWKFRIWYKVLLTGLGIVARGIITVSEFSKAEIKKYYYVNEKKIEVVYLGADHLTTDNLEIDIFKRFDITKNKYILAVSNMNPNKNFKAIVDSMRYLEELDVDVVIAGGTNPRVFSAQDIAIDEKIKYIGYVNDDELKALYRFSTCFVFPSFYEGFGLPPLEAMACGCPVIVSNAASIPEVCGDAAIYCDPHNPHDIAEKIKQLCGSESLRKEMARKGLNRIRMFRWRQCAGDVFRFLETKAAS